MSLPFPLLILLILVSLAPSLPLIPRKPPTLPSLYLWNASHLSTLRHQISARHPIPRSASVAIQHLRHITESDLSTIQKWGMPVVTNKSIAAPGAAGDRHYFASVVPYAFSCTNLPDNCVGYAGATHANAVCRPDGLPWKICDGQLNQEILFRDRKALEKMIHYVIRLTMSGFLLQDARRSEAAADLLRAWFLDERTRMYPSLRFAQGIPGVTNGKPSGCMDLYFFGRGFTDAVALLAQTPGSDRYLTRQDRSQLSRWFGDMAKDMVHNPVINPESKMRNNHGVYYDLTVTSLALLAGDEVSRTIVNRISGDSDCWEKGNKSWCLRGRFESQVDEEGGFQYELNRADAGHYVWYTLLANSCLATFASVIGNDAGFSSDGGLVRAADWALSHALNAPDSRIAGEHVYAVHAYRMLAHKTGYKRYEDMACEILMSLSKKPSSKFWEIEKVGTDVLELAIPPLQSGCEAWDAFLEEYPDDGLWNRRVQRESYVSSALVDSHSGPGIFRRRETSHTVVMGDRNSSMEKDEEVVMGAVWPYLVILPVVFALRRVRGVRKGVSGKRMG